MSEDDTPRLTVERPGHGSHEFEVTPGLLERLDRLQSEEGVPFHRLWMYGLNVHGEDYRMENAPELYADCEDREAAEAEYLRQVIRAAVDDYDEAGGNTPKARAMDAAGFD